MAPVWREDGYRGGKPVKAPGCWLDVGTLQQRLPARIGKPPRWTVEVDIAPGLGARGFQGGGAGRYPRAGNAREAVRAALRTAASGLPLNPG